MTPLLRRVALPEPLAHDTETTVFESALNRFKKPNFQTETDLNRKRLPEIDNRKLFYRITCESVGIHRLIIAVCCFRAPRLVISINLLARIKLVHVSLSAEPRCLDNWDRYYRRSLPICFWATSGPALWPA